MNIVAELNRYAQVKGVEAIAKTSLDGLVIGLFVPPGQCVFESSTLEEVASYIDMLALAKENTNEQQTTVE